MIKFKKFFTILLIGIVIANFTTGCARKEQIKEKKQKEKSQEETIKMVEVDFKEIKKLDEVLKEVVEEKVKERGYFFILSDKDDSTTLVISAGEKPTEGYEVKVTNAIQEGDILTVIVEEIEPSDDEIVADKISYPYTVVKLENTDAKEFYVIDVEGKEFFNIEKETKEVKAKGIFNGTIGNDSIEILLDGEKEPRIFNTEELKNLEIPKKTLK